jgi:hypothetical protein
MFCSMIYEANERPRHATATVAIRSKPIAPGFGGCEHQIFTTPIIDRFERPGNLPTEPDLPELRRPGQETLMNTTHTKWHYLERDPKSSYHQLSIKGRRIKARTSGP